MASSIATLATLVAQNDRNLDAVYISDLLQDAPFLAALFAKKASNGTLHKYLKTTAAAGAGFREIGTGRDHTTFTQTLVTATLYYLDASFHVDKAFADSHSAGVAGVMEQHGMESLKSGFAAAETQLINGTLADSGGFAGMRQNGAIDALADAMVVNAGNATANSVTSVYAVRTGDADAALVSGQFASGNMLSVGETTEQFMPDANGKFYAAYAAAIGMHLGLQFGGAYSVGRLCNIGAAANKLTDTLLAQLLAKFPAGRSPSFFLMNRQSLFQLQASRTATSPTGEPAPIPSQAFNIPIVVSDSVLNTEAVVA